MSDSIAFMSLNKDKLKATANKLLNECFLLKRAKNTAGDYQYILNNREEFSSFFELLGYELIISEEYGVISLNNQMGTGRIHLKKVESILLLIIRLLYIEKRKQLSQSEDVIVVVDEIYDKYAMLKMKTKLDKATIKNSLRLFKRYNLIFNLDSDMSNLDTRILIWPSVVFAVTVESLDEIYQASKEKLEKYASGGELQDDQDNEETDED